MKKNHADFIRDWQAVDTLQEFLALRPELTASQARATAKYLRSKGIKLKERQRGRPRKDFTALAELVNQTLAAEEGITEADLQEALSNAAKSTR